MACELLFKNLPFVPVEKQVIYIERSYHENLNTFIRANYEWLKDEFLRFGFEFCYLPISMEETISYNAPYLTKEQRVAEMAKVPSLTDYLVGDKNIDPALIFALDTPVTDDEGNTVFQSITIDTKWFIPTKIEFSRLIEDVNRVEKAQSLHYHELRRDQETTDENEQQVRFSIGPECTVDAEPKDADSLFDIESQRLIQEIEKCIEALRNKGVNTMFLHGIIDKGERISRLRITKDYRIFLVDYDNKEIKLPILPKAVFLLFLHHPEGIRFKELADYYPELLKFYIRLKPFGGRMRQEQSIRDVIDPCNNSINEKCARIREAFVRNIDERLAKNYYITGKRGEPKRIILDNSMIIWE